MQISIEHKGRFFRFAWVNGEWLPIKKNGSRCRKQFPIAVWKKLADQMNRPDERRCKTCKWWGRKSDYRLSPEVHRACDNHTKLGEIAMDADSLCCPGRYDDELTTGPDFGCWHHVLKTGLVETEETNP